MKKPLHQTFKTHRAPYYGGEKMARTLEEAFGPGAKLHVPLAKLHVPLATRLRRRIPEVMLFVSAGAVIVSFVAALVCNA